MWVTIHTLGAETYSETILAFHGDLAGHCLVLGGDVIGYSDVDGTSGEVPNALSGVPEVPPDLDAHIFSFYRICACNDWNTYQKGLHLKIADAVLDERIRPRSD
jgi:hypothetical protein